MARKSFVSSFVPAALALAALALVSLTVAGCSDSTAGTAVVNFSLTDAPVASDAVKEVYVTFSSLEVNEATAAAGEGSWLSVPIDTTQEYELLSLTGGLSEALGSLELSGGTQVNQIRFGISAIELVETADALDAARHPVTLSSETGLKIVNAFDIPLSGEISIVVDFDVRKSLVSSGTGYKMKPTLRAIVENEAGEIEGTAPAVYLVFAYPSADDPLVDIDLTFTDAADDADAPAFDDAYTSANVGEDLDADGLGSYTLAFMDAGNYDLVLVDPADGSVAQVANDVLVASAQPTSANLTLP